MYAEVFQQAIFYLAAAVLAVPIARRLGLGSALGYLLAGVLIGPYALGLVGSEGQDVMHFAEFGVVLMLFLIGLELDPAALWRMRVPILGLGGLQVGLTTLVIGIVVWAFGLPWQSALAVGMILALSSTAMVLQTLEEKGWNRTNAGRKTFSVLLFQDVAVIPILSILPFLALPGVEGVRDAAHGADGHGVADLAGWMQASLILLAVASIVLAGRYLARPVFRYIASTRSHELFIATALLLIVAITLAMYAVGLSPALGTFLAGVVLAESEFRHELESDIEPFKGLLLGLFFIAVGASIDLQLVGDQPLTVAGLVLALIGIKLAVLLLLGRIFRLHIADNLMFSFVLAQGGEFAFLLVSFALQNAVLEAAVANMLIVVVVLSMIATPLVLILYERFIQPRFVACASTPAEDDIDEHDNPVIIAGFGRFGQIVSRLLKASGFETTLLDHDVGQIELVGGFGNKVFYGDASRDELLRAAGAENARLLVIAIDDREKAIKMALTARMHFPHLKILARAIDRRHAYELIRAGADVIRRETFGSALMVGEEALKYLGFNEATAARHRQTFQEHDEAGLRKLYEVWGDDKAYGLRIRQNLEDLKTVLKADQEAAEEEAAGKAGPPGQTG
jgi:monovalent cation:proton antiporter-2 (CPA2) family protein